jgi:DNA-binding NtrC family response regulator
MEKGGVMLKPLQVLVAVSDAQGRRILVKALTEKGLNPLFAETLTEARKILDHQPVAMVFCETDLKDGNFKDLLFSEAGMKSKAPVVVCAQFYDKDLYMDAMGSGAFDFIAYPYARQEVDWILNGVMQRATAGAGGN